MSNRKTIWDFAKEGGWSPRTPAKHWFLDAVVGRFVRFAPAIAFDLDIPYLRTVLIELTAGPGWAVVEQDYDEPPPLEVWQRSCGPGILAAHAVSPSAMGEIIVRCNEKRGDCAQHLSERVFPYYLPELGYEHDKWTGDWLARAGETTLSTRYCDSRTEDFSDLRIGRGDFVFMVNDGNTIDQWALNAEVVKTMKRNGAYVMAFNTMGCNPAWGNLKRFKPERRSGWQRHLQELKETLHEGSDIVLGVLKNDRQQWAYANLTARWWTEQDKELLAEAFSVTKYQVVTYSYRDDPDEFDEAEDKLLTTARERQSRFST